MNQSQYIIEFVCSYATCATFGWCKCKYLWSGSVYVKIRKNYKILNQRREINQMSGVNRKEQITIDQIAKINPCMTKRASTEEQ